MDDGGASGARGPTSRLITLAQNAPNPVQAGTRIGYTLGASGPVTLAIFDLQGRRVATLLDHQPQPAGEHSVTFNTAGWPVGCYLYRLDLGSLAFTRKMLLVR